MSDWWTDHGNEPSLAEFMDRQTRGLIAAASRYLADGRWFILEQTRYGTGMCAPAAVDVLALIESGEV